MLGLLGSVLGVVRLAVASRGDRGVMVVLPLLGLRSLRTYDFSGTGLLRLDACVAGSDRGLGWTARSGLR